MHLLHLLSLSPSRQVLNCGALDFPTMVKNLFVCNSFYLAFFFVGCGGDCTQFGRSLSSDSVPAHSPELKVWFPMGVSILSVGEPVPRLSPEISRHAFSNFPPNKEPRDWPCLSIQKPQAQNILTWCQCLLLWLGIFSSSTWKCFFLSFSFALC